jgi:hypothetical protein
MLAGSYLNDWSPLGLLAGSYFYDISPLGRVCMAAVPVAVALLLRLMYGRSRTTEILLTVGTSWFLVNVFIAPHSVEIEQELYHLLPFIG